MEIIDKSVIENTSWNLIVDKFNSTITKYGKIKFSELSYTYLYDISELEKRQNIIKNIVHNDKIANDISDILKKITNYDDYVHTYFSHDSIGISNFSIILNFESYSKIYSPFLLVIIILYLCDFKKYSKYVCILIIYIYFVTYNSVNVYKKYINETKEIVLHMCKLFDLIEQIYELDIFIDKKNIEDDFELVKNNFVESRFVGNLLKISKDKEKYVESITNVLQYVGLIDSYICIAKIVKTNKYIFPNYEFNAKPYLYIENIFHPLIDKDNCKLNDVYLGDHNVTTITGPSGSGKSIHVDSIIISVLMSQIYCISNSDKMIFTPFQTICLYVPESEHFSLVVIDNNKLDEKYLKYIFEHNILAVVTSQSNSHNNINICKLKNKYPTNITNKKIINYKIKDGIYI